MVLFDKFIDMFCDHTAVVNEDPEALKQDVEILQKKYGPWFKVRGFADFKQFFLALHLAKKTPFSMAFIRDSDPSAGEAIIKKVNPDIKTLKYSDTQQLSMMLEHR